MIPFIFKQIAMITGHAMKIKIIVPKILNITASTVEVG